MFISYVRPEVQDYSKSTMDGSENDLNDFKVSLRNQQNFIQVESYLPFIV